MGAFEDNQWQPGQSGNPAGRPKGSVNLTAKLRVMMEMTSFKGKKLSKNQQKVLADKFLEVVIDRALKGDTALVREIWNRLDGCVTEKVELSDTRNIRNLGEEILEARRRRAEEQQVESNGDGNGHIECDRGSDTGGDFSGGNGSG